jgi:hypothetical protein
MRPTGSVRRRGGEPAQTGFPVPAIVRGPRMAKEEHLEMNGVVDEVLPDSRFRVTLDNGHTLDAYSAGRPRPIPSDAAATLRRSLRPWPFRGCPGAGTSPVVTAPVVAAAQAATPSSR